MKEDLYAILDECLNMLDQGSDLESCLARYPEYASELRPLLMASMDAESLSVKEIPVEVVRRSKSKILNAAAELRERKSNKKPFFVLPPKRLFRLSFAALITLLLLAGIGGTSLVRASAVSLPGDQFYPIKITWENLLLKLAVSQIDREDLEDRFAMERVQEIEGLFSSNRSEEVKFSGQVDGIFPDQISVSGIPVVVAPQTRLDGELVLNARVRVEGVTTPEGVVIAERIKVESSRSDDGKNIDQEDPDSDDSGKGSGKSGEDDSKTKQSPEKGNNTTPENNSDNNDSGKGGFDEDKSNSLKNGFEIEGVVSSYNGGLVTVGNRSIFIIPATELRGDPTPGSQVSIRGFVNEDGVLIALRIDVKSRPEGGGSGNGGGGNSDGADDNEDDNDDDEPDETPEPDD
jgi:hypothetical protein